MIALALSLCGPVERCLVIARWRVADGVALVCCFQPWHGAKAPCRIGVSRECIACTEAAAGDLLRAICPDSYLFAYDECSPRVIAAFDKAVALAKARGV